MLDRVAAKAEAALEMVDRGVGVAAAPGGVRRRKQHRPVRLEVVDADGDLQELDP